MKDFDKTKRRRHLERYHPGVNRETIPFTDFDPSGQDLTWKEEVRKIQMLKTAGIAAKSDALEKLRALYNEHGGERNTRLGKEIAVYTGIMFKAIEPNFQPFTRLDLGSIMFPAYNAEAEPYTVVVCDLTQAAEIFKLGTPAVPILISNYGETSAVVDIGVQAMCTYIASKSSVAVQEFGVRKDPALLPESIAPSVYSGQEAMDLFRGESTLPVNLLDLEGFKSNAQPAFLANQQNFQALRTIEGNNTAGKPAALRPADLRNSSQFQLLAKAGAWSMPHCDHHGVITTVYCDEGRKQWLTYPEMTMAETDVWADSENYSPPYPAMNITLERGSLLVIPPGRLHAPFSLSDVAMTGTMHWDTRNMIRVLLLSMLEVVRPGVTNEDPAIDFLPKIKAVAELWQKRSGTWEWGTDAELKRFLQLIDVRSPFDQFVSRPCN